MKLLSNLFSKLPLIIEGGTELMAIAELIKESSADGKITPSERYAIYERLTKLLQKFGMPEDFTVHPEVSMFDAGEVLEFEGKVESAIAALKNE